MKILLVACLCLTMVHAAPARHLLLDELLGPLTDVVHAIRHELKPVIHNALRDMQETVNSETSRDAALRGFASRFHVQKRNFLSDLLAPLKAGFQKTKEQLKPYLHQVGHNLLNQTKTIGAAALSQSLTAVISNAFSKLFHGRRNIIRRNFLSDLLAPLKAGFQKTKEQLKPYLHQVGHDLLNQTKTIGAAALSQSLTAVISNAFSKLFHGRRNIIRRNFLSDLLAPLKAGFQKTKEQLKPYLHQVGHDLLNQTKTIGAAALSQSLTAVISNAFSKLFHGRRNIHTAIKKIGDFGAKLKNLLDPRISQLLESFDEVMTNIKRVAIKVSRETVHPEKAVHDIDAIVTQHRITGDLVTKYLKKDLQELLSPGNLPAMFVDLLHEVGKEFEDVFSRLQRVVSEEGRETKTRFLSRLQHSA